MEDPDILLDLWHLNKHGRDKYQIFWTHCQTYLNECTAIHECRHGSATYMAKTISVRDLIEQVAQSVLKVHFYITQYLQISGFVCNFVLKIPEPKLQLCTRVGFL